MRKILDRVKDKYRKFLVDHYPKVIVDRIWLRIKGHKMIWNNPKDLNEKIQWMKCMSDTSQWSILTDKLRVRDYIESKGYADTLPKIYGVWDSVDAIDYAKLPQKFVIKCNHDCGSYHIIDKSFNPDFKEINKDLNNSLKKKFGYNILCEPHYNKISPRIFAEEYLPLDNFWWGG